MVEQKPEANLLPETPVHAPEMPAPTPETQPRPEQHEQAPTPSETEDSQHVQKQIEQTVSPAHPPQTAEIAIEQPRDELAQQIEKIMEEDLGEAFDALTTVQKQEFKIKGEQTVNEIRELMKKTKVKMNKIFKLLVAWLAILPGINKFFLEQEAKIKADKILALKTNNKS